MESPEISLRIRERLIGANGEAGREWLARFPALLREVCARWDVVSLEPAFEYVGYAWVAPVRLGSGEPAVLKLAPPGAESVAECAALRLYDGDGAVRVLEADPSAVALLLERLEPGTPLADLEDDTEATAIAARAMVRCFRPLPANHGFPTVERLGAAFARVRAASGGGCGPFPADLFDPAERLYFELCASQAPPVLLHGDLHHWNILRAGREPWLVIDPKGVAGEPAFEPAACLRNRVDIEGDVTATALRRIAQFAETLAVDRERVLRWGFAAGMLSALWRFEDHGDTDERWLALPRALRPFV